MPPERVVDLLALVSDAVDNIPGVPGIGDKGARDLLQQFGLLDELIARASEVKRAAHREGLMNHADKAHLSRQLATLDDKVPVSFDPEASVVVKPNREAAYQFFKEMEFSGFAREMAPEATTFSFKHRVVADAAVLDGLIDAVRRAGQVLPAGLPDLHEPDLAKRRSRAGGRGCRRRRGLPSHRHVARPARRTRGEAQGLEGRIRVPPRHRPGRLQPGPVREERTRRKARWDTIP